MNLESPVLRPALALLVLALSTLLVPASGQCAPHPDFAGSWLLDPERSDSPDAVLELLGKSAIERALARKVRPRHVIVQDEAGITLTVESALQDRTERIPLDGSVIESPGLDGQPLRARFQWSADGQVIVMDSEGKLQDGRPLAVRSTRQLQDPRTMVLTWELDVGGRKASLRRVFRKEGKAGGGGG
jgi:hypothetical protein